MLKLLFVLRSSSLQFLCQYQKDGSVDVAVAGTVGAAVAISTAISYFVKARVDGDKEVFLKKQSK